MPSETRSSASSQIMTPRIARALWATMDLFRWLAVETAQRWQYTLSEGGHRLPEQHEE